MSGSSSCAHFILSAFDKQQWCPVLQARFSIDDVERLRPVLGEQAKEDPQLHNQYIIDRDGLAHIVERFGVSFDAERIECKEPEIFLFRIRQLSHLPYLVHTGYELPLLIDGRKKLARFSEVYPPSTFEGEDRFDQWVAKGFLHKEEFLEPFDHASRKGWLGQRTVYYTPKGEEWRVAASRLIWGEFGKTRPWDETLERLEGLLFGYEDWQNDRWIEHIKERGGSFSGASLCCPVDEEELDWIKFAGFRALPPFTDERVSITSFDADSDEEMLTFAQQRQSSVALVRFNVLGRYLLDFFDARQKGPWAFARDRIPEFNQRLRGSISIAWQREGSDWVQSRAKRALPR